MKNPIVSIVVLTYFHEKYIRQAMDSIFSQKTDYSYEVVVADDCSTDGTRSIVMEYREKYPKIVRCSFNYENVGIPANLYKGLCQCTGKYITLLSGDDYWLGEDVLQRKISFMENNPNYYALCTKIEARLEGIKPLWVTPKDSVLNRELTMEMYLKGIPFHTHGMVFKNEMKTEEGRGYYSLLPKCSKYIDDSTMCLIILNRGAVYAMNILAYVYRVENKKNNSKSFNAVNNIFTTAKKQIELYNNLHQFLPQIDLFLLYKRCLATAIPGAIIFKQINELKGMIDDIPNEYKERGVVIRSIPAAVVKCAMGVWKRLKIN